MDFNQAVKPKNENETRVERKNYTRNSSWVIQGVIRSDKQQVQTEKQQTPTKRWKWCIYNYMKKSTRTTRRAASMECLEMKEQMLEIN